MAYSLLVTKRQKLIFLVLFSSLSICFFVLGRKQKVNDLLPAVSELQDVERVEASGAITQSKCSQQADSRGKHQKVVAFSLFGELSDPSINFRYLLPLIENAKSFPLKYPGWVIRIYHDITVNNTASWDILNELFGSSSELQRHVDLCYVNDVIGERRLFSMTWRFLPLLDDLVDVFVSRDTDSLITEREIEAVNEWLQSNQTFHVMRDHLGHCIPILGGLWGVKLNRQRIKIKEIAHRMLFKRKPRHYPGLDQDILRNYLWPYARNSMMSHDSFCCVRFREIGRSQSKPFPSQRSGDEFVGKVANWKSVKNQWPSIECPVQCRLNPDWKYC